MKKIVLSIMIMLLFGLLVACGNRSDESIDETEVETETEAETESEKETETEEDTVEETAEETEEETIEETVEETAEETTEEVESNGKNHNGIAADLAYDVEEIRALMDDSSYDGEKIAFLTFDDGPNNSITVQVLDTLKAKGVQATFFLPGKNISSDTGETLKRMYNEGHAIATHSFTHDYKILYPGKCANPEAIVNEELKARQALKDILGEEFSTRVFRYPGGHMSWNKDCLANSDAALKEYDIHWIDWNTMTGDAQRKNAGSNDISRPTNTQEVLNNFDKSKTFTANPNVAVILMHDSEIKQLTADSLSDLIDHIESQGYKFGILE